MCLRRASHGLRMQLAHYAPRLQLNGLQDHQAPLWMLRLDGSRFWYSLW